MTLQELANKLSEIYIFDYLTFDSDLDIGPRMIIWKGKPKWQRSLKWYPGKDFSAYAVAGMSNPYYMKVDIDLSEYADDKGNIDYSKCIVEVKQ